MGDDSLVGLRCHGRFYTCVVIQLHQQLVFKRSVDMCIPIIGRMRAIWDKLFFKVRISFDGKLIRKKVFSEYSNCIETHLDVVVEVLEVHNSVAF